MRRRKPAFSAKEKTDEELKGYSTLNMNLTKGTGIKAVNSKVKFAYFNSMPNKVLNFLFNNLLQNQESAVSGGFWTDEDIAELIRLVKKYPNGTLSRWEVIAKQMDRSVQEVTFMSSRMKEVGYRQSDSVAETLVKDATKKVKKVTAQTDDKSTNSDSFWTQDQQKLLEIAIVKYPKTTSGDRWLKVSNSVPDKTKEECLARYKYLVQKVKEQKLKETAAEDTNNDADMQQTKDENTDAVDKSNEIDDDVEHEKPSDEKLLVDDYQAEPTIAPTKKSGGKPRNKRKERKKRMEFSSDDEDYDYEQFFLLIYYF